MSRQFLAASMFLAVALNVGFAAPQRNSKRKPPKVSAKVEAPVTPRQENQFVTVEEFVKARRAPGTAVSVEGYVVIGVKSGSNLKLDVVDSVDHVLNASDANKFAAGGASATIPGGAISKHPSWGLSVKGMQRFTMYTGPGMAQRQLHDIVPKVRITGRARGKSITVTGVEYADDNGDWKKL
jgi:hypothetical protein